MSNLDLLPCPFCGEKASYDGLSVEDGQVYCTGCLAIIKVRVHDAPKEGKVAEYLAAKWNQRILNPSWQKKIMQKEVKAIFFLTDSLEDK